MALFVFFVIFSIWLSSTQAKTTLLDKLNFFIEQNRYTVQPTTFQSTFSLDAIMSVSLELAMRTCQNDFKWEHWNCPNTDFFLRSSANRYQIDREDAYVQALMTAAALYTITKDCSSGITSGCGCDNAISMTKPCADDPEKAISLYKKYSQQNLAHDFRGLMVQHNFEAIATLMKQSLIRQCGCTTHGCAEENCMNVLRPFAEISKDIKLMYEEGLQLTTGINTQIMWSNIPLDSLVYGAESPNYCDLDAVPNWPGMHGRQCIEGSDDDSEYNSSCQHLCYECGYRVRTENIVTEHKCNCKFTWNYQVQCERCMNVEQEHFCY